MEKKSKEQCCSLVKEISSHPLFSILATFSLLVLLYSPHLLPLLCSPVLVSTSLLLTTLLHLGSPGPPLVGRRKVPSEEPPSGVEEEEEEGPLMEVVDPEDSMHYVKYEQETNLCESFVDWGRRGGPLAVIYEEFEGDEEEDAEDENDGDVEEDQEGYQGPLRRLGFMGSYESSCSSTSSAAENMKFLWEEEEEEEEADGMIEITLDEDNLIEIDLRTCR